MDRFLLSCIAFIFSFTSWAGAIQMDLARAEKALTPELLSFYEAIVFVNVSATGPNKQRAWVMERNGNTFSLSQTMVDRQFWKEKSEKAGATLVPSYSWPVTSGRSYGDGASGPTSQGIFNLADKETSWDPVRGHRPRWFYDWGRRGMKDAIYIDLAWSSNRLAGIAMHGTPERNYRILGTKPDSHGCVRSHQRNSRPLLDWYLSFSKTQIPSFFDVAGNGNRTYRTNYVRTGEMRTDAIGDIKTHLGFPVLAVFFSDSSERTPLDLNLKAD